MNITNRFWRIGAVLVLTLWTLHALKSQAQSTETSVIVKPTNTRSVSGPYAYKNLEIYLVHDRESMPGKTFTTLEEALKARKVIVHETGQVNELAIENISKEDIYVQSGDIVKGGRQDRVISFDFVLPPASGKVPIASFCVERSRWSPRGTEDATKFDGAANQITSKDLKIAAKHKNDQGEVWAKVAEVQGKLSKNLDSDVKASESATSLQLTLENEKVRTTADDYVAHFKNLLNDNENVIGFVFVINGEVNSGDTYLSKALFKKLWPKLLNAAAIEAISEKDRPVHNYKVRLSGDLILSFLKSVEDAPASTREITKRISMSTRETETALLFETYDRTLKTWIHRNYIKR